MATTDHYWILLILPTGTVAARDHVLSLLPTPKEEAEHCGGG